MWLRIFIVFGPFLAEAAVNQSQILPMYYKLNGSNTKAAEIGKSIQCTESHSSTYICERICNDRIKNGTSCLAYKTSSDGTCALCSPKPASSQLGMTIEAGDAVFINTNEYLVPDFHYTLDTIISSGLDGFSITPTNEEKLVLEDGVLGKAVYFKQSDQRVGSIELRSTTGDTDCFCNFLYCSKEQLTISFWMKPLSNGHFGQLITTPRSIYGITIAYTTGLGGWGHIKNGTDFWVIGMGETSTIPLNEWTHAVLVVDIILGSTWYLNGVKETFKEWSDKSPGSEKVTICHGVRLGAKNSAGHFPLNVVLDELDYFYKVLSSEEIWMKYIQYELPQTIQDEEIKIKLDPIINETTWWTTLFDGETDSCKSTSLESGFGFLFSKELTVDASIRVVTPDVIFCSQGKIQIYVPPNRKFCSNPYLSADSMCRLEMVSNEENSCYFYCGPKIMSSDLVFLVNNTNGLENITLCEMDISLKKQSVE